MRTDDTKNKDIFAMDYNGENEPIKPKKNNTALIVAIAALLVMASSVIHTGIERENSERKAQEAQRQDIGSVKNNASSIAEMLDKVREGTQTVGEQSSVPKTAAVTQQEEDISSQAEEVIGEIPVQSVGSHEFIVAAKPLKEMILTMAYSYKTDPVFSPTLSEYRSDHTGSDYAAEENEDVYAVAKGKVTDIYENGRYGVTVTVDHGNGIVTEYSNLLQDTAVVINQNVESGTVIGKVGNSALYEVNDTPHLHFSVKIDDEYVDPQQFLRSE